MAFENEARGLGGQRIKRMRVSGAGEAAETSAAALLDDVGEGAGGEWAGEAPLPAATRGARPCRVAGPPPTSLPGARCCSKHRLQPWNWPRKAVPLRVHVSYSLGSVRT